MELCLSCVGGKTQCVFAGQCLVDVYAAANAMASQNKCGQSVVVRVCWLLCANVINYMGGRGSHHRDQARTHCLNRMQMLSFEKHYSSKYFPDTYSKKFKFKMLSEFEIVNFFSLKGN